jgi:hypothetical protein
MSVELEIMRKEVVVAQFKIANVDGPKPGICLLVPDPVFAWGTKEIHEQPQNKGPGFIELVTLSSLFLIDNDSCRGV